LKKLNGIKIIQLMKNHLEYHENKMQIQKLILMPLMNKKEAMDFQKLNENYVVDYKFY
jgi:hypothetical protein